MNAKYTVTLAVLENSEIRIKLWNFSSREYVQKFLDDQKLRGTKIIAKKIHRRINVTDEFQ